jgi:hypothetical protein
MVRVRGHKRAQVPHDLSQIMKNAVFLGVKVTYNLALQGRPLHAQLLGSAILTKNGLIAFLHRASLSTTQP